jgi:hypothetical protein
VLLPDTGVPAAVGVAERIRREFPVAVEVPVTLSIGIGGLDLSKPTGENLRDNADFALYQVKRAGRDSIATQERSPLWCECVWGDHGNDPVLGLDSRPRRFSRLNSSH